MKDKCEHDYENAIRKHRSHFICPKCKKDITMAILMMYDAGILPTNKEK